MCANVLIQLWRWAEVRDELEQPLNGIELDDKSGPNCQDHGVKRSLALNHCSARAQECKGLHSVVDFINSNICTFHCGSS